MGKYKKIICCLFLQIGFVVLSADQNATSNDISYWDSFKQKVGHYMPSWHYAPALAVGIAGPIAYGAGKETAGLQASLAVPALLAGGFGLKSALNYINNGNWQPLSSSLMYYAPGALATIAPYLYLGMKGNIDNNPFIIGSALAGPSMIAIGHLLSQYAQPLEDIESLEKELADGPSLPSLSKYLNPVVIVAALLLGSKGLELLMGYLDNHISLGAIDPNSINDTVGLLLQNPYFTDTLKLLGGISLLLGGLPFMGARLALLATRFPLAYEPLIGRMANRIFRIPLHIQQRITAGIQDQLAAASGKIVIPPNMGAIQSGVRNNFYKAAKQFSQNIRYQPKNIGSRFRGPR